MERATPPPVPDAAPPADPEARPATLAELRSLRRWMWVAIAWAIAATAIAIIALVDARSDASNRPSRAEVSRDIGRSESGLSKQIASLRGRLDGLPSSEDVRRLDRRLARVEDDVKNAGDDSRKASDRLDRLERRVEKVEQKAAQTGGANSGGAASP